MPKRPTKLLALVLVILSVVGVSPAVGVDPSAAAGSEPVGALPTTEDFVTQQYEDFLGRPPDQAGLDYWVEQIEGGLDPSAVVESLALSSEFEGTIAPVVRLYYAHFLRPPDYDGMTHWAGVARNGWSMEKISEEFVLSQEFINRYGSLTDSEYVEQVYQNVLGRAADAAGKAHWTAELGRGMTRGELMVAFSDSAEYRRTIGSRVLATMLYVGMLRRAPESSGLDYWAQTIGGGAAYRNVIAGFLGANEYRDRIDGIYHDVQPLTGVAARSAALRPALAVKIDNVRSARPPTNVHRADLVYEEMVEGNLTRLIAVFHSDLPLVVGPVRSVRTTDIDILAQFNRPLLAASGANAGVLAAVAGADLVNVNALEAGGAYYRSSSRRAPHNMYARVIDLYTAANHRGKQPPQLYHYRKPGVAPANGGPTNGVGIEFGRTTVDFAWSSEHRGWARTQDGTAHVTASGERLAPTNVLVLEVPYGVSPVDANSPEAHTVGSGPAYVFTGGQLVTGTWSRSAATDPMRITDANNNDIRLTRGQTFIELAPPGSIRLR